MIKSLKFHWFKYYLEYYCNNFTIDLNLVENTLSQELPMESNVCLCAEDGRIFFIHEICSNKDKSMVRRFFQIIYLTIFFLFKKITTFKTKIFFLFFKIHLDF